MEGYNRWRTLRVPFLIHISEYLCMHEKKAELKEKQKYHYWDVNFKCSYTKNPWNEKYVRIIQNNSKTFELRLVIKKRSGY